MALPLWDSPAESRFLPREAKAKFGRVCRKEFVCRMGVAEGQMYDPTRWAKGLKNG